MKTVSVTAHFDGKRIPLDEPLELEPNTKLIVTVLPGQDFEREVWQLLAKRSLAGAYADDEEGYSMSDVKVINSDRLEHGEAAAVLSRTLRYNHS